MKLALVLMVALAAGCSSSGRPQFVSQAPPSTPSTTCPFGVRGARLSMSDTEDGVVIALRAYGQDVTELRKRARDAAAMYGPGAHRGLGHDGAHGGGEHHGLGLARLGVPVSAVAEDTAEGAKITVVPKVAADLEKMRQALHERESRTRAGTCP
jgi:hypothetical protein